MRTPDEKPPEKLSASLADPRKDGIQPQSRLVMWLFGWVIARYIRRQFHAVRMAHAERFRAVDQPLIVCVNHPSWWDPLICITVYRNLMPNHLHYAPMDAEALRQYGFFRKIGLFPIEMGTARGAAQFLRGGREVLADPGNVLWVTPQGEFTDQRQRPTRFKPGLGALVHRMGSCTVLPLAIEYTYWDQRLPEVLLLCGAPVRVENSRERAPAEWTAILENALETAQDELVALAKDRDAKNFSTLAAGGVGVGGFYQLWQRVRARIRGEAYKPEHHGIGRV